MLPDRRAPSTLLMISGGSGITPVMSMLRSLRDRYAPRAGSPSCTTRTARSDQIFADELDDDPPLAANGIDLHLLHPELGDPNLSRRR